MLTRDEPEFVQLAAALLQHPAMPTDSLERLGTRMFTPTYKGFAWVFTSILENPNLTPGLLQQMVKLHGGDSGKSSRYALQAMMHPNYDQPALYQLLTASNHRLVKDLLQYRDYVQNPALPEKEIRYLASPEVIRHIFEMPGSDRFIGEVAANPNTPRDILYNLLRRKAPEIDRKLITNTAMTASEMVILWQRAAGKYHHLFAENSATPGDILQTIAAQDDAPLKKLLSNANTPAIVLEQLYLALYSSRIKRALNAARRQQHIEILLKHPNISGDLMDKILHAEEESRLVGIAAANPGATEEVLEKIARQEYDPFRDASVLLDSAVNKALVNNPATPQYVRRKLRRY